MNLKNSLFLSAAILGMVSFFSCRKVISVNLNSTAPRYVITGNITDQPGPYLLSITQSVNFSQDNIAPAVSGATVVITDITGGLADSLTETSPGNYQTHTLVGAYGHQYHMYVNAAGNVFTASSTMPQPVTLDSLYTQQSPFGKSFQIVPVYFDPIAKGNYYLFNEVKNDTEMSAIFTRNDQLINGQLMKLPLEGGGGGSRVADGDVVEIDLECIDSPVYAYFSSLQQTKNQNSATPANPATNISNGALGYFSAHTVSSKTIVVP